MRRLVSSSSIGERKELVDSTLLNFMLGWRILLNIAKWPENTLDLWWDIHYYLKERFFLIGFCCSLIPSLWYARPFHFLSRVWDSVSIVFFLLDEFRTVLVTKKIDQPSFVHTIIDLAKCEVTRKNSYPLLRINGALNTRTGSKWFSTLKLSRLLASGSSFYQKG